MAKIEERVPVGLLLARCRRDVASVRACSRESADAARVCALLLRPVAHEGVVVGVQLELLGELLLRHVEPLVVHAGGLIVVAAEICWQVVANVDDLGHVLHLVAEALRAGAMVDEVEAAAGGPEAADSVREVLVLRRRAVAFDGVEIELGLVGGSTDAPLVDLRRDDAALVGLLLVQRSTHLLVDLQLGRAHLVELLVTTLSLARSKLILLWCRLRWRCHIHLLAVPTGLRPPLDLVLDLLRLLLVRLSDGQTLAHLQLL